MSVIAKLLALKNAQKGGVVDGKLTMNAAEVGIKGHHLYTKLKGHEFASVYPATPYSLEYGTNGTSYHSKIGPLKKRVIMQGNATDKSGWNTDFTVPTDGAAPVVVGSFTTVHETNSYRYLAQPIETLILQRVYFRTGNTLAEMQAHTGIRLRGFYANIQLADLEANPATYDNVKFADKSFTPADIDAETLALFTLNGELDFDFDDLDYPEGQVMTWWITSIVPTETFKIITNADNTLPWRALNMMTEHHEALVPTKLIFPAISITSPTAGQTAVSLTPTITSAKGLTKDRLLFKRLTDLSNMAVDQDISWDNVTGTLEHTAILATLRAGVEYRIRAGLSGGFSAANGDMGYKIVKASDNTQLPDAVQGTCLAVTHTANTGSNSMALATYTPTVDTDIKLRITYLTGGPVAIRTSGSYFEIEETTPKKLDYTFAKQRTKIVKKESQETAIDETGSSMSYTVPANKKLSGATDYQVFVQHMDSNDIPLQKSSTISFTTMLDMTININTTVVRNGVTLNLASGDLIELNIGESLNAVGYNFHVSGKATEFPPAAYTSGSFRFQDTLGNSLNFQVASVTGTAPNRMAKCYIEVNAQVVSSAQIKLVEGV